MRAGKARYAFVTLLPLTWLVAVTMTAGIEKIWSSATNIGFLAHAESLRAELASASTGAPRAAEIGRLILNDQIDAAMTLIFIACVSVILIDSIRVWSVHLSGARVTAPVEVAG